MVYSNSEYFFHEMVGYANSTKFTQHMVTFLTFENLTLRSYLGTTGLTNLFDFCLNSLHQILIFTNMTTV